MMPRKPKTNQPETPDEIQGRDLFQTPDYALDLLYPYFPVGINLIWEPAAGEGKIARWLERNNYEVVASDIRGEFSRHNFLLEPSLLLPDENYAIITNPPFSLKKNFFYRCLEFGKPFALLIPADYSLWVINAIRQFGCRKLVPSRRIDYITPNGKSGKNSNGQFHSMWLCKDFNLPEQETFVELTNKMKENI